MPKHKTLSDLLVDDVRDYFLREGVGDQPSAAKQPPPPRQRNTKRLSTSNRLKDEETCPASYASASSSAGTLRAEWSTSTAFSPLESERMYDDNRIHHDDGDQLKQTLEAHRRHNSSGSGSLNSRGSASSRSIVLSAVDAEFLRRYAEEREQANLRAYAGMPGDLLPAAQQQLSRPYQPLVASPRPPTVAGSHRPGLPSIDNERSIGTTG